MQVKPTLDIKTILLMSANPRDGVPLPLHRELNAIHEIIEASPCSDQFNVIQCQVATPDRVYNKLLRQKPQIVHFCGHGEGEAGLVFENEEGRVHLAPGAALAKILKTLGTVECVVLNACSSALQAQEIAPFVPYVIGMSQAVQDTTAQVFARGWYRAVADGYSYAKAFEMAKGLIDLKTLPGADVLTLFVNGSKVSSVDVGAEFGTDAGADDAADMPRPSPEMLKHIQWASLTGAVSLDSPLYVPSGQEKLAYEAIQVPGSLLRIRSPKEMGKSSLNLRLMDFACQQGYRTVTVDFRGVNAKFFQDQDRFTQWFCASVGRQLGIRVKTEDYWDDIFGANGNCEEYFETYVLRASEQPLVLALENYDQLFDYPEIEKDFSGLLRGRHDRAKLDTLWQRLRLVLVYSQEAYETQDINQSPFNVGLPITLGPWTAEQVGRSLQSHGLHWSRVELNELMALTGGHPQLVRIALAAIANQQATLAQILVTAATEAGLYSGHLLKRLTLLEAHPELRQAMQQIVSEDEPVRVKAQVAKKLDSMGLIVRQNYEAVPLCDVYRLYFRERL